MSAPHEKTLHAARWPSAQSMATASWICPVLIIAINFALGPVRSDPASRPMATMLFAATAFVLASIGLTAGLSALLGVRRHGREGVLVPALIGSAICSIYIAVFFVAFLA